MRKANYCGRESAMAFICPNCNIPDGLKITFSMELPSDSRSDEIAVQLVECDRCRFQGAAIYTESRRGRPDSESVEHTGYRVGQRGLKSLGDTLKKCPRPDRARCRCPSHRALNWRNDDGYWQGLGLAIEGSFPMQFDHRKK